MTLQYNPTTGALLYHSSTDIRAGATEGTLMSDCCCGQQSPCDDCTPAIPSTLTLTMSGWCAFTDDYGTHSEYLAMNTAFTLTLLESVTPGVCIYEASGSFTGIDSYFFRYSWKWYDPATGYGQTASAWSLHWIILTHLLNSFPGTILAQTGTVMSTNACAPAPSVYVEPPFPFPPSPIDNGVTCVIS